MDITARFLEKFREFRSRKFEKVGKLFVRLGISANLATSLSIICGIIAVYFLFQDLLLFIIFAVFHLLLDGFDGIIARAANKTSRFGEYFDHIGDSLIGLLLIGKVWWVLRDYYVLIIIGLFLLMNLVHFFSRLNYPWTNFRTVVILLLMFNLPTISYLAAGVITVYALALQFKHFIEKSFPRRNN